MTGSLLFDLMNQMYAYTAGDEATRKKIFEAKTKVLLEPAEKLYKIYTGKNRKRGCCKILMILLQPR